MNRTSVRNVSVPLRIVGLVTCLLLVAGCQATGPVARSTAVAPEAGAATARTPDVAAAAESAAPKPGPQKANAVRFDPEEFVGYAPERVLPILGAPDFVRRDGNAQVWQYRAEQCVLDLFLYGSGNDSRVKHVELRKRAPDAEPVDQCFARMRAKRRPKPAG